MELVWYGEDTKALDRQYNSTITTEKNCKKKWVFAFSLCDEEILK